MVDQTIDRLPPDPEGLEILAQLDQIIVKPQSLWFTNYSSYNRNTYKIFNSAGEDILFAEEQSTQVGDNLVINIREFSKIT